MGRFERGYGLVIGVSEYSDPQWNVPIAERDAQAIHAALTDPGAGGYRPHQVELVTGPAASSRTVQQALDRLASRSGAGDTAFIAFTGHGARAENDLYTLATSDAMFVAGQRIKDGTGLTIAQLARALKEIRAERLLLVINACFAGHTSKLAAQGGLRKAPPGSVIPDVESEQLLGSGKGRALISASRADQRSYFSEDDAQSVFGQALIDGLRGVGMSRRSGYIGLFELYDYVYTHVRQQAASRGLMQEPVLNLVEGVGAFPVALHSGAEQPDVSELQPKATVGDVRVVQINEINQINAKVVIGGINAQVGDVSLGDIAGNSIYHGTTINMPATPPSSRGEPPPIIPSQHDIAHRDVPRPPATGSAPLIDFGSSQIGSVHFRGDIVPGDITKTGAKQSDTDEEDAPDPLGELQKIRGRVEQARNVDEDARDDATNKLKQAHRALDQGDKGKALQRIAEALEILDAMGNGYINSAARKLRKVREALS